MTRGLLLLNDNLCSVKDMSAGDLIHERDRLRRELHGRGLDNFDCDTLRGRIRAIELEMGIRRGRA